VIEGDQSLQYRVHGGGALRGAYFVQGSKNAALPAIAAALLPRSGSTTLRNVPPIRDVLVALEIARELGARIDYYPEDQIALIDASKLECPVVPERLSNRLRASILFMGPLLARLGEVRIGAVGGCALGTRAVDFHYRGFARMGAEQRDGTGLSMTLPGGRLHGATTYLDVPSHTGTENLMMAACLAQGTTLIENAGAEPEICDLARMLMAMGARIRGLGTRTLVIEGVPELRPVDYSIMPDRLDAGFALIAVGVTGGEVKVIGAELQHLRLLCAKLHQMGVEIEPSGTVVYARASRRPRPINVVTWPHPGFATDLQPALMALACFADGRSYFREKVFDARFSHVPELVRMGARIEILENNQLAVVDGTERLHGAQVQAANIRAGIAVLLAGLGAEGATTIRNVHQLERGYHKLPQRLQQLGARIEVLSSEPDAAPHS
jgi:UDP-N-acetylglucosamine 1-carboxyvinyltransferase